MDINKNFYFSFIFIIFINSQQSLFGSSTNSSLIFYDNWNEFTNIPIEIVTLEKILNLNSNYFFRFNKCSNDLPRIFLKNEKLITIFNNKCQQNTISIKTLRKLSEEIAPKEYYQKISELYYLNKLKEYLLNKNKDRLTTFSELSESQIKEMIDYLTIKEEEIRISALFIDINEKKHYKIIYSHLPVVGIDNKKNQYCNFFYSKQIEDDNPFLFSIIQYKNNYYPADDQKSFLFIGYYLIENIKKAELSFKHILKDNLPALWNQMEPDEDDGYLYFWIKSKSAYKKENKENEYEGKYFENLFYEIFKSSLLEFTIREHSQNHNVEIIKMKINYSQLHQEDN